jgi:propanediol dehydratase small subunit
MSIHGNSPLDAAFSEADLAAVRRMNIDDQVVGRTRPVNIRLTPDEFKVTAAAARQAESRSVTEFCRTAILELSPPDRINRMIGCLERIEEIARRLCDVADQAGERKKEIQ